MTYPEVPDEESNDESPARNSSFRLQRSRRRTAGLEEGDEVALREFFLYFQPVLLEQARFMGIDPALRKELVITFLDDKVIELVSMDVPPRSLTGYVIRAFRNRIRNDIRDRKTRDRIYEQAASQLLVAEDPAAYGDASDEDELVEDQPTHRSPCSDYGATTDGRGHPIAHRVFATYSSSRNRSMAQHDLWCVPRSSASAATSCRTVDEGLHEDIAVERESYDRKVPAPVRRFGGIMDTDNDARVENLARLLGRELNRISPELDGAPDSYLKWLAREARLNQTRDERASSEADADDFVRRMAPRIKAQWLARKFPKYALRSRAAAQATDVQHAVDSASHERCAPLMNMSIAAGAGRALWDEPCEEWIEIPISIPDGRYVALRVSGDSMQPFLESGDVVLVKLGAEPARDDIVVARTRESEYVVKRVVEVSDILLQLESLNPAHAPFSLVRKPGAVLGTVMARFHRH
jgi:phage repressor protein C with HTH and peptisase S24 domain